MIGALHDDDTDLIISSLSYISFDVAEVEGKKVRTTQGIFIGEHILSR
jgi:hypothetical protein